MRIPIAESEIGVWYPIEGDMYFVSKASSLYNNLPDWYNKHDKESTFAEFKEQFPYEIRGTNYYRTKDKLKRIKRNITIVSL